MSGWERGKDETWGFNCAHDSRAVTRLCAGSEARRLAEAEYARRAKRPRACIRGALAPFRKLFTTFSCLLKSTRKLAKMVSIPHGKKTAGPHWGNVYWVALLQQRQRSGPLLHRKYPFLVIEYTLFGRSIGHTLPILPGIFRHAAFLPDERVVASRASLSFYKIEPQRHQGNRAPTKNGTYRWSASRGAQGPL